MTVKEKQIIRDLAKTQKEKACSPEMQALKKEWIEHNTFKGSRPMITVELRTFGDEIVTPMLKCQSEEARALEKSLLSNTINADFFGDDTVIKDYFPVHHDIRFKPFGIEINTQSIKGSVGVHFISEIRDLSEDFHKLGKSEFSCDKTRAAKYADNLNELFGDILPVKISCNSLACYLTYDIIRFMSMEDFFTNMYDYPDLFKEMMNRLTKDYLDYFRFLENEDLLLATTSNEALMQGSYCFTDELPDKKAESFLTKDIWGHLNSQETVGISPEMFEEFIFPYYKKIAGEYGLLSYGCCEPVDSIWENCLSRLENLRKVSISPWCDEEYMGAALAKKNIIYFRKPSPNFIGVGESLDESALRSHIIKTLKAAKNCKIEFAQRDVYTVNKDIEKVKRYVEIIREECVNHFE